MQIIALIIALFCLLNVPQVAVDRLRSQVALGKRGEPRAQTPYELEIERLRGQVAYYADWFASDKVIREEAALLAALEGKKPQEEALRRRAREIRTRLSAELRSEPARILCRDPAPWGQTVWIERRPNSAIHRDSPVLVSGVLVGIVDWISRDRARVRLLTDPTVVPAVRVMRGGAQDRALLETAQSLRAQLSARPDLGDEWTARLDPMINRLKPRLEEEYGAKGELCGALLKGWRGGTPLLNGVGFNYDFADEEGERSVKSSVQTGDLLITSGFDGIFPAGLRVATVETVETVGRGPLQVKARSLVPDWANLGSVTVLPPLGYQESSEDGDESP